MNPQMIKKIQQMEREIKQIQEEIEKTEFTSQSGVVTVVMLGNNEIKSVMIDPEFQVTSKDDLEMLADMVVAASHKANEEIKIFSNEKLAKYNSFLGRF